MIKLDRLDISERSLKKKKKYLKYSSKHLKETGLEHDTNMLYIFELDNAIKIIPLQKEDLKLFHDKYFKLTTNKKIKLEIEISHLTTIIIDLTE